MYIFEILNHIFHNVQFKIIKNGSNILLCMFLRIQIFFSELKSRWAFKSILGIKMRCICLNKRWCWSFLRVSRIKKSFRHFANSLSTFLFSGSSYRFKFISKGKCSQTKIRQTHRISLFVHEHRIYFFLLKRAFDGWRYPLAQ